MTRFEIVRKAILADPSLAQQIVGAAAVVILPTALRWVLGQSASPVPFVTYFPFVLLAAVFLGWRWAALATLASAVVVDRIFLARPWLEEPAASEVAILIFFAVSCAVLVLTGETLRRTVRQMAELAGEREFLIHEMYHRIQNTISVIQALVKRTGGSDTAQFRQELLGRLQALAQANRILRDGAGAGSPIGELIEQATKPFHSDGTIDADGPDCTLPPEAAHHLVLILHELCTNALKHGALSVPGGRVTISWTLPEDGLNMVWRESDGPIVSRPSRKGLGLQLLEGQRTFTAKPRFEPTGVVCELTIVQNLAAA